MNDILFEILKAVIILAVTLVIRFAVPYIRAKMDEANMAWLVEWVKTAVYAAEQTITESGAGEKRKQMVLQFLNEMIGKTGIKISESQLDNLIESAVYAMKNGGSR